MIPSSEDELDLRTLLGDLDSDGVRLTVTVTLMVEKRMIYASVYIYIYIYIYNAIWGPNQSLVAEIF